MRQPLLLILCLGLSVAACSMPRITVWEDPLSAQEHLQLGAAYEARGEWELALAQYRQAARELPLAHLMLGNVYFQQQQYPQAEKQYRQAIAQLPADPRPYNNLAWLYYTQGIHLADAEHLARRAIALAGPEQRPAFEDTHQRIMEAQAGRRPEARPARETISPPNGR